jgi:ABC-type sugar transport system permease subunit
MAVQAIPRAQRRAAQPSFWQRLWDARLAYLYIFPAGVIMFIITFLPILFQVWMSLTDYGVKNLKTGGLGGLLAMVVASFSPEASRPDIPAPSFIGLQNFYQILTNRLALSEYDFWRMLGFNLVWTFINVFFHVVLGVAFAMLLNTKGLFGKRFYRAFYIIPWALPALISGMVWHNMYDKDYGAVNLLTKWKVDWLNETVEPVRRLLQLLGERLGMKSAFQALAGRLDSLSSLIYYLIAFGVVGLIVLLFFLLRKYDPGAGTRAIVLIVAILLGVVALLLIGWKMPYSFYAVLIANIWLGWPFMMTVATGALQGIPEELYEAARIDGASAWQVFWQVTVPLLRPAMIPAIMIGMMMTFNQFNVIYFVTGGNPLHRTEILVTQAFRLVNEQRMYGVAAAFSFIVFVILAALTMVTNRVSRATESYAV